MKTKPGPALALLQEALDKAFPEFVGLTSGSGETLDSLFRDARIKLKESGRDLVLLFEDLVQFGPIDGALYAQFRNQPTDDLAPLRVVFAITSTNWDERGPRRSNAGSGIGSRSCPFRKARMTPTRPSGTSLPGT